MTYAVGAAELKAIRDALDRMVEATSEGTASQRWTALAAAGWTDLTFREGEDEIALAVVRHLAFGRAAVPLLGHLFTASALGTRTEGTWALALDARRHHGRTVATLLANPSADQILVLDEDGAGWQVPYGAVTVLREGFDSAHPSIAVDLPGEGTDIGVQWLERLAGGLAAQVCGALDWATKRTADHLQTRIQFRRPLAANQVLQHRLVDMVTSVETLDALVARSGREARWGWSAKALAGDRGPWVAEQAIQLHGGMGFSWETGLHAALRQTTVIRGLLGGPQRAQREALADLDADTRPAAARVQAAVTWT